MTEGVQAPDDTARSIQLERWAGIVVVASIALMLVVGSIDAVKFLFWVPFAVGIGLVLPALAILAGRERDAAADPASEDDASRDGNSSDDGDAPGA